MMKLRVRLNKQTIRVEVPAEDPTVADLTSEVKENVLPSFGLSSETQFSLSLNGSELLTDTGQTLSSCGIVPGDLLCVVLPQDAAAAADASNHDAASSTSSNSTASTQYATAASREPSKSPAPPSHSHAPPSRSPAPLMDSQASACGTVLPVWEPMLCSEAVDGQTPLSLERLFHGSQASSPSDAIMVAAHLLMTESGFNAQAGGPAPSEMPVSWRLGGGVYKLQYTHPLCGDSVVTLSAVCMGAVLIITVLLSVEDGVLSLPNLSVDPRSFITEEWRGQSAASVYKDLSKLSRVFKDQLVNPVIAAAREAWCLPAAFGLTALPPELLLRVLRLLDVRSLLALASVCSHFQTAAADSTLWRHLCRRDFPDQVGSIDSDWKQLYKSCYHRRCEQQRTRSRLQRHFHVDPGHIVIPPPTALIPPPPGIIGGEYDQRPFLPPGLMPRPRYDLIGPYPTNFRQPPPRPSSGSTDAQRGFI